MLSAQARVRSRRLSLFRIAPFGARGQRCAHCGLLPAFGHAPKVPPPVPRTRLGRGRLEGSSVAPSLVTQRLATNANIPQGILRMGRSLFFYVPLTLEPGDLAPQTFDRLFLRLQLALTRECLKRIVHYPRALPRPVTFTARLFGRRTRGLPCSVFAYFLSSVAIIFHTN